MVKLIIENKTSLTINENKNEQIISKKLPIFYNEEMKINRTITILLLKSYFDYNYIQNKKKNNIKYFLRIADILAGSGIRSARILKEWLENDNKKNNNLKDKINIQNNESDNKLNYYILINDLNPKTKQKFLEILKLNFNEDEYNKILNNINITENDANIALLNEKNFDYIDIDPFGSPNQFLDTGIKKIKNKGILAVTATDTAPLCGTYTSTCRRKYDSIPLKNYIMHETSLRILIRKIQCIGMQYEKALIPVLAFSNKHYLRVFFKVIKSKKECDEIIKKHKFVDEEYNVRKDEKFGKIWTGKLYDPKIIEIIKNYSDKEYNDDKELKKFIKIISEEYDTLGFFDTHEIASKYNRNTENIEMLIKELKKLNFSASRTQFSNTGIKTNAKIDTILKIMQNSKK